METNKEMSVIGYFLLFKEEGGQYLDTWSRDISSWFIEKNSESEKVIKKICAEYDPDGYNLADLMNYINSESGTWFRVNDQNNRFYNEDNPHTLYAYLYTAIKIGDEVFRKVSIINPPE